MTFIDFSTGLTGIKGRSTLPGTGITFHRLIIIVYNSHFIVHVLTVRCEGLCPTLQSLNKLVLLEFLIRSHSRGSTR